jgi:hypothetical protein
MTDHPPDEQQPAGDFRREASRPPTGFVRELLWFLARNRKWWLVPLILALLLIGLLVLIGGTGAGPFIYTLF